MTLTPQVIDKAIAAGWFPPWHRKTRTARLKFGPREVNEINRARDYWLSPDGSRLSPLPMGFYDDTKGTK